MKERFNFSLILKIRGGVGQWQFFGRGRPRLWAEDLPVGATIW